MKGKTLVKSWDREEIWRAEHMPPTQTSASPEGAEFRYRSETGGEKGMKNERLGGADPNALRELAKVYSMGENKYARYNYLKGYPWSLSVDALYRHLLAFLAGEDRDPQSGLLHTAHVAWHALTLTAFVQRNIGTDDRAPGAPVGPSCDHGLPLQYWCFACASDKAEKYRSKDG